MTEEASKRRPKLRWPLRLLLSIGAALSAGALTALVLGLVDLYLSGHGQIPLGQMGIGRPDPLLTVSDVIMLASMLLSGLFVWFVLLAVARPARRGPRATSGRPSKFQ